MPNAVAARPKAPKSASFTSSLKDKRSDNTQNGVRPRFPPRAAGARDIAVQAESAALSATGELDLQAFLRAREFEIGALTESMALSRSSGKSRAFQQVPRALRRRTASHNFKRVPKRLRRRAEKEMHDDNTPRVTARRRKPTGSRGRIRAETAKRLKALGGAKKGKAKKGEEEGEQKGLEKGVVMGGIVQEQKNQDVFMGGTVEGQKKQDVVMEGTVEGQKDQDIVMGNTAAPHNTIKSRPARPKPTIRQNLYNDPPNPHSKFRRRQQTKTWLPTHMWHAKRARMTAPGAPLWRFVLPLTPNEKVYRSTHRSQIQRGALVWDTSYMSSIGVYGTEAGIRRVLQRMGVGEGGDLWTKGARSWSGMLSKAAEGKRRDICPATVMWNPLESSDTLPPKKKRRQILMRIHPSAFSQVFAELLHWTRMERPRAYIEDLRWELGSIELTGPAATECLHAMLRPTSPKNQHASLFESLKGLTNAAAAPNGALLAFDVRDPRLDYPPRWPPLANDDDDGEVQFRLCETLAQWPADKSLNPYAIFDRTARLNASRLPSQKSINRRKGATLPGCPIPLTPADPPIPVLLLLPSSSSSSSSSSSWTLLAPWKTIQPLWHTLVRTPLSSGGVPRFGGIEEARQVAFERGTPCFPYDFIGTDAGAVWETEMRARRKAEWERRPKGKRTAWESVGLGGGRKGEIGEPWGCAWEEIFKSSDHEMDLDLKDASPITTTLTTPQRFDLRSLTTLTKHDFSTLLSSPTPAIPTHAIVTVHITLSSRGIATPRARIYRLPTSHDLREQWLAQLPALHPARPPTQSPTEHPLVPDAQDLVGFVLVGSYSLAAGRASALACLIVERIINTGGSTATTNEGTKSEEQRKEERLAKAQERVCVVRNVGEGVGRVATWSLV